MQKENSIKLRPFFDLAVAVFQEKMAFIKYEKLVKTTCESVESMMATYGFNNFKFPENYR